MLADGAALTQLVRTFLEVSLGYHSLNKLRIAAKPHLPALAVHAVVDGNEAHIVAGEDDVMYWPTVSNHGQSEIGLCKASSLPIPA